MRVLLGSGIVLLFAFAMIGCGDEESVNKSKDSAEFYVNYTIGDTEFALTHGLTNFGDVPLASFGFGGGYPMPVAPLRPGKAMPLAILAAPAPITNDGWPIESGLIIELPLPETVPFTNQPAYVSVFFEGNRVYQGSESFMVTVTNFGAVGEAVSGSFSGSWTNYSAGGPAVSVTGTFRVKRVPDGSYLPPS